MKRRVMGKNEATLTVYVYGYESSSFFINGQRTYEGLNQIVLKKGDTVVFNVNANGVRVYSDSDKTNQIFNLVNSSSVEGYSLVINQDTTLHAYTYFVSCVPGYSLILTDLSGGTKRADELKVGDSIVSYNFNTGYNELVSITNTETPIRDHVLQVYLESGSLLEVTEDHAIWTNVGWACFDPVNSTYRVDGILHQLEVGQTLYYDDGTTDVIKEIVKIPHMEGIQMYDFTTPLQNFYAIIPTDETQTKINVGADPYPQPQRRPMRRHWRDKLILIHNHSG